MGGIGIDLDHLGRELCPVVRAFDDSGCRYAVIGATAILIHGFNIIRATRDVDLVLAIDGGFEAAKDLLIGIGLQSTNVSHRYRTSDGTQLDVLPIADAESEQGSIQMPEGGRLTALGLGEAIRSSAPRSVGGCSVAVAGVPILVALKLIAALERTRSDLADSCVCLSEYASNDGRRHLVHFEHSTALTFETSGAYLVGADFTRSSGEELVNATRVATEQLLGEEAMLIRAARALRVGDDMPEAYLLAFLLGMDA